MSPACGSCGHVANPDHIEDEGPNRGHVGRCHHVDRLASSETTPLDLVSVACRCGAYRPDLDELSDDLEGDPDDDF